MPLLRSIEFSPCYIFLCKEEDPEILKQGLVPPGDIEIRRSIPLESIDFYSYAVLDVDGTKQVKIRNAIHHSPGQFDQINPAKSPSTPRTRNF